MAVVSALLLGAIVIVASGHDPLAAYRALASGALGDARGWTRTLANSVPLALAGLAVAFAFRGGLFNIGAEGQLVLGAVAAAWAGRATFSWVDALAPTAPLPWFAGPTALLAGLAAGALAGAVWGAIPGALKAWRGAHEVITTIMLNYVGLSLVGWLIGGVLRDPASPFARTAAVPVAARLPALDVGGLRVHAGLLLALLAAAAVAHFLARWKAGFALRVVGHNPDAARYAGVSVARATLATMAASGALAGLAGAVETLGRHHLYQPGLAGGIGFDAIAVALLGGARPAGVLPAALLFGAMDAGATRMQRAAGVPSDIIDVVQALILALVAAQVLVRWLWRLPEGVGEGGAARDLAAGWGENR